MQEEVEHTEGTTDTMQATDNFLKQDLPSPLIGGKSVLSGTVRNQGTP